MTSQQRIQAILLALDAAKQDAAASPGDTAKQALVTSLQQKLAQAKGKTT